MSAADRERTSSVTAALLQTTGRGDTASPGNTLLSGEASHETHPFLLRASRTASAVIGMCRTRAPTALWIAFATAGATTVEAGSPTPLGWWPESISSTSIGGTSARRIGV